jgi:hypothetical protein
MSFNSIFLEQCRKMPGLKINEHPANSHLFNVECITRQDKRGNARKNVAGNITFSGNSFIVYIDGRGWKPIREAGIKTVDDAIAWIKKDVAKLSK